MSSTTRSSNPSSIKIPHGSVPQVESKMNVITVLYVGGVRGGAWSLWF